MAFHELLRVRSVKHVEQKAFDGGVSRRGFPGCVDCRALRNTGHYSGRRQALSRSPWPRLVLDELAVAARVRVEVLDDELRALLLRFDPRFGGDGRIRVGPDDARRAGLGPEHL